MPIQVEITVGKKVSSEVDKHTWRTVHYSLTCNMGAENMADVEAQKVELEAKIDEWLAKHTGKLSPTIAEASTGPIPPNEVPRFDLADIDALPWKQKEGKESHTGSWGWIFSDIKETIDRHEEKDRALVAELGHAIRKAGNDLKLGDMVYSYGKNTDFIRRVPAKRESAR